MDVRLPGAGVELEARVYEARGAVARGVAVIAHRACGGRAAAHAAYGYVGGTLANPVVVYVAEALAASGVHAVTYNARGVGASGGRISWTMRAECDDMQALTQAVLQRYGGRVSAAQPHVYIVGYSAGSMQASTVRVDGGAWRGARVHYVLISYPLGVRWLLTALHTGYFARSMRELVCLAARGACTVAVAYGTCDEFTGAEVRGEWAPDAGVRTVARRAGRGGAGRRMRGRCVPAHRAC